MHDAHTHLSQGLQLVAKELRAEAEVQFRLAAAAGSVLGQALAHLVADQDYRSPYDQARAFQAFINGGGNVALYAAVHEALAGLHHATEAVSLLDIGTGDGRALLPPLLDSEGPVVSQLGIVEPSVALLESLKTSLAHSGLCERMAIECWPESLQDFLRRPHNGPKWKVAQATFSLQSLPPVERIAALKDLKSRIQTLAIVEFDVPDLDAGSEEEMRSIAARFESGLTGYGDDAALVAEGFLAPMLLGKVRSPDLRHNWEQPARHWVQELKLAGYAVDDVRTIAQYSWSPAFMIIARPIS